MEATTKDEMKTEVTPTAAAPATEESSTPSGDAVVVEVKPKSSEASSEAAPAVPAAAASAEAKPADPSASVAVDTAEELGRIKVELEEARATIATKDAEIAQLTTRVTELESRNSEVETQIADVHTSVVGSLADDDRELIESIGGADPATQTKAALELGRKGKLNSTLMGGAMAPASPVNNTRAGTEPPPAQPPRSRSEARQAFAAGGSQ